MTQKTRGVLVNSWLVVLIVTGFIDLLYYGYSSMACLEFSVPYILVYPSLILLELTGLYALLEIYLWKKRGFYLYIVTAVFSSLVNCFINQSALVKMFYLGSGIIAPLVLFLILSKSRWKIWEGLS